MLVGAYLDPIQSSTTSKSAESGNYEAFVVFHYCQLQLIQLQIIANIQDRVTLELLPRKFRGRGALWAILGSHAMPTSCFKIAQA